MKIAYLTRSRLGTTEANASQVARNANALARAGHSVYLFARHAGISARALYDWHDLDSSIRIITYPLSGLPKYRAFSYGSSISMAVNSHKPFDLIYGRDLHSVYYCRNFGMPFIYESHKPEIRGIRRLLFTGLLKSPNFRKLIVVSNALAQVYRTHFPTLRANAMQILPNGTELPAPSNSLGAADPKHFDVGYIGSTHPRKGLRIMMDIAQRLPDVRFAIIGPLPRDCFLRGSPSNLYFLGPIPPREASSSARSFKCVVAPYRPSRGWSLPYLNLFSSDVEWGSPIKLFEYMASGGTIVASDIPICRELLSDNHNAMLCSPTNLEAWTETIAALLENPDKRRRLATKAQETYYEHYTSDARMQKLLS